LEQTIAITSAFAMADQPHFGGGLARFVIGEGAVHSGSRV
jgi:hypothetical protein